LNNAIDNAAAIYVNVINLFLRVLRIMGGRYESSRQKTYALNVDCKVQKRCSSLATASFRNSLAVVNPRLSARAFFRANS
jgi:hypothetical protein